MFKVVAIVDKEGTAIDRLAKGLIPYFQNINYVVIDCHPKRPSPEQLYRIESECKDADIIDAQYFKTIESLRNIFPWLRDKKTILFHHNPYSIEDGEWNDYELVVANNRYIYERLGEITHAPVEYVPLTIDTDFWTYNTDWKADSGNMMNVLMVANRIEGKKGVLPVAEACKKLNLNLQLVGAISDAEYFQKVIDTGMVRFHEQISDEELKKLYYKSTVHICNSVDGFESGTLPLLEAMLCGTPVITRSVGHVPELYNGENMIINDHDNEDVDHIASLIYNLIVDKKKMEDMRDKAWNTAKSRSNERRATMIQKLYKQVAHPDTTPVSVVVPITDKPDIIRKCLDAISKQTYQNIELIVADDSISKDNEEIVRDFAQYVNFPVRYMRTVNYVADVGHPDGYKDYGLARARNTATIEALGDIMVYVDQRQIIEPDCIENFVKYTKPNYWLYGNKGVKKEFVENLSCALRSDVLRIGGFNERINLYGGQSQELRTRMRMSGISQEYVESARATPAGKSSNRNQKRNDIIKMKNKLYKMFGD